VGERAAGFAQEALPKMKTTLSAAIKHNLDLSVSLEKKNWQRGEENEQISVQ